MKVQCQNWKETRAFSLVEILSVLAVISLMTALTVATVFGVRTPGLKRSAMGALLSSLEEARLSAVERRTKIYFGITTSEDSSEDRRLAGYVLFRELSEAEKSEANEGAGAADESVRYIAISRWEKLPRGFYFDPQEAGTLLQTSGEGMEVEGLPGGSARVVAIGFGERGQVVWPSVGVPHLTVTEAKFEPASGTFMPLGAEGHKEAGRFRVAVSRLTGRVMVEPENSTSN